MDQNLTMREKERVKLLESAGIVKINTVLVQLDTVTFPTEFVEFNNQAQN